MREPREELALRRLKPDVARRPTVGDNGPDWAYHPDPAIRTRGMNATTDPRWHWEKTDPARSGSSGDLSKLFRHEETKNPGAFSVNAPPSNATLMAREVIQNSWDAARDLQSLAKTAPDFEIVFRFSQLSDSDKQHVIDGLDLTSLATRANAVKRDELGLSPRDCLSDLDGTSDLPVLIIEESGTTGMYGPWQGAKSRMYLALVSLGYTMKAAGAGGSYGFGKAGLIRGSTTRTVLAYTCFKESADDPGVTRRLLGMTYWGQHDFGSTNFTGFARFGQQSDDGVVPFENDEADAIAAGLGLDIRRSDRSDELGTTFLLIEPTVEPAELLKAIERSWWPALTDQLFEVSVQTPSGSERPRPLKDDVLRSFVRAYEVATVPRDNPKAEEKRLALSADIEGTKVQLGVLGLTVDQNDWSYADQLATADEDGVDHRSLIALTRDPRMVVEYLDVGRSTPYVRGVFVADSGVNDDLRRTEPKSHDSWQTVTDEGTVSERATAIAKATIERIRRRSAEFRRSHKPETPPAEQINLPFFDSIMRKVMSGGGTGWKAPIQDTRPVSIRLNYKPEEAGPGRVRVRGSATIGLSDHFDGDDSPIDLSIVYRFLEDDRVGQNAELAFKPPAGLSALPGEPGKFVGELIKGEDKVVKFVSEPYSHEWSGRLIVSAEPMAVVGGDAE